MANYGKAFHALGDPTRRAILESLRSGPQRVGAIAGVLPVSQPAVSQHLKVLKEAGLVTVSSQGASRVYAIDPAGLIPARAYLDSFWTDALDAFADAAKAAANLKEDDNAQESDRPDREIG